MRFQFVPFWFLLAGALLSLCACRRAPEENRAKNTVTNTDASPVSNIEPNTSSNSISLPLERRSALNEEVTVSEADWPYWRGPTGNNIALPGQNLPEILAPHQNVLWKTRLPGLGRSSPIVIGNHLYLTTADPEKESQSVLCLDRHNGNLIWKTEVNQGGFPRRLPDTHASLTLACNGEALFALFENHERLQLVSLDLQGRILRQITASPFPSERLKPEIGPSPLLYQSFIIVAAEFEDGKIQAFDQDTLSPVWIIPRKSISYSSPIVAYLANRDQLLIPGNKRITSYDPQTGEELWNAPGGTASARGTVAWEGDILFTSGASPDSQTVAIRATENGYEELWTNNERFTTQSLLACNGHVYGINDTGVAFCWRADDGKEMWSAPLCGPVSASPILADGIIYQIDQQGKLVAFRDHPELFEKRFEVPLGTSAFATPTICHGRLFCRVIEQTVNGPIDTLYCFGLPDDGS